MPEVTLRVCDVCYPDPANLPTELTLAPTRVYELKSDDGRKAKIRVCEAHSQTMEAFLPRPTARPAGGDSAPRRPRKRVTTLDEIEKLKK